MEPTPSKITYQTPALVLGIVLLATLVVYWPVRGFEFVTYDDHHYVVDNPLVQHGLTAAGVRSAFSSFNLGYWIPVTLVSLMLDAQLWGQNAGGFHITNLLLHLANVVLFFLLVRRLTGRWRESVLAAALFALHPIHVQSVAWVTERKDVLSCFFWLASLLAYLAFLRRRSATRYSAVALFFGLGLMAKPMLVTLPVVLLVLDHWPLGRTGGPRGCVAGLIAAWKPLVLEKAPLFAMALAAALLTIAAQSAERALVPLHSLPFGLRAANAVVSAATYLGKAVVPHPMHLIYLYPQGGWGPWRIAASAAVLVGISVASVLLRRRHGYLIAGWLWFLGALIPVSGLFQAGVEVMADRFAYVPFQGLYLAASLDLATVASRLRAKPLLLAAGAAAWIGALALTAGVQVAAWRDTETLFRRAVATDPGNWIAQANLGIGLLERGELDAATAQFTLALEIAPRELAAGLKFDKALVFGKALLRRGAYHEAERLLAVALALQPDNFSALTQLGQALAGDGRWEEAAQVGEKAVQIEPGNADAHTRLGMALSALGRRAEALEHFRTALRSDPDNDNARYNLALSLIEQGRFAEAVPLLEELCRRKPADGVAHYQLGLALRATGDTEGARRHFTEADRLGPGSPEDARSAKTR